MMAAANVKWKDNEQLSADLKKYVEQRLQRNEILDYMQRDYDFYFWSIRTLDRRLDYFNIRYIDGNIPVANIREAVAKELEGPGALLGYRAMTQKIRQKYHLQVPRDLIHGVMFELDPEGLARRTPGAKKRKPRGHFVTMGPNWTYSLDGHDKLMGYQNSTFPLAIYGCIDTASRKLIWLKIWNTNSNPLVIGKWYLESLMETKLLPNHLRMDKGTETNVMSTMHSYLRSQQGDLEDPTDSIIFGPSPSNQIERWWRELHDRLEKFFKVGLVWLKEQCHYNPHDPSDRSILAFIMIPLMQQQLDEFRYTVWNSHRIRAQKDTFMADGVPNHIFEFPERYGMEKQGFSVKEDDLKTVSELAGVLDAPTDYISARVRAKLEAVFPEPDKINATDFVQAYLSIKYSSVELENFEI